jgi:hypothetical protein
LGYLLKSLDHPPKTPHGSFAAARVPANGGFMADRIDDLEKTILDLGAEVFKLKHALVHSSLKQAAMAKLLDGLKVMLEDKGYVSADEIEETAIMNEMLRATAKEDRLFEDDEPEILRRKSDGH